MKDWFGEYLEIREKELTADLVQGVIDELIAVIENACKEIDWETLTVIVRKANKEYLKLNAEWTIGVKVRATRKEAEEEEDL